MKPISMIRLISLSCAIIALGGWAALAHAASQNLPPTLNPIANVVMQESCVLDQAVTGSDPDGDPLTFSKAAGPTFMTVTTTSPTTGNIHLATGFSDAGVFGATVTASDGSLSDSKSFTIQVISVDRAPVLIQPANMTVNEGATADQTITASDPDVCDMAALTFSKTAGPTFMFVTTTNATTGNIHLAPGFTDSGSYAATVSASDGILSDRKSFTITVNNVCRTPIMNQPANMTVNEGATANQTISGTSPDGSPMTFTMVSGPTFMTVTTTSPGTGTATGNINLAPGFSDAGSYVGTIMASDGVCGSATKSLTITVNNVNPPGPTFAQPADMTVNEGATADQTLFASDPDGDPITFSEVAGPTFMTVTTTSPGTGTGTGNIHLAPGFVDSGTYPATVSASDPFSSTSKSLTITVNNVNRPPTLAQPANMTAFEGSTADQTLSASDADGDALTFSKVAGPTFMIVTTTSATTGNVHVAPGFGDGSFTPYPATVRASDGTLDNDKSFTIAVPLQCRTTLFQPANMTVDEGATADQILTGSDPDGRPQTFTKVSGPLFMTVTTLSATTGDVHLAPSFTDAGTYSAMVRATNDCFATDTKSFTIVANQVCNGGPVANAGGPYQGFVNVPIQFDGSGSSDPNGGALTFMWDYGDGSTGTGVTPQHTYTTTGNYAVVLAVTGDCGTSTSSTTAQILTACDAIAFTDGGNRTVRLNSGRPSTCVQIEPQTGCYRNEDVILPSIVMKYTGGAVTEIHAITGKTVIDKDTNGDGIAEITACFRKEDLRELFSGLPEGQSTPTVTLEGDLTTGGRFQAALDLRVISNGGGSAATVAPNPLNSATTLTFATSRPGYVKIDLYDVSGRLVRTVLEEPSLAAGVHDVRIEGRGSRGETLASGIYFIRGASPEGEFTRMIAILK